jgi:hypothetical protein
LNYYSTPSVDPIVANNAGVLNVEELAVVELRVDVLL